MRSNVNTTIAQALLHGRKATGNNTVCTGQDVTLHGSVIARCIDNKIGVTLAGWNTVTTRARVNAILDAFNVPFNVHQQGGKPRLWSQAMGKSLRVIDARDWLWFSTCNGKEMLDPTEEHSARAKWADDIRGRVMND